MHGMLVKQSRKELEWRQRLARLAASGKQVKLFCQAELVSEASPLCQTVVRQLHHPN